MQYCLAIDVACGKSMFCILSEAGELVLKPTEYQHTISGFGDVLSELVKLNSNDIHIIMESTSVYHLPVERYFRENTGYETIVLNPIISKENKRNLRKTKTDKEDCLNLANIFFRHDYNEQTVHEDIFKDMQFLSRQLEHLQDGQIRTKNRFRQLLTLTCPQYSEVFVANFMYSSTALHFIACYPHCDMVKHESIATLAVCLGAAHNRSPKHYLKMASKIKEVLQDSYPAVPIESETVTCLVETVRKVIDQATEIEALKSRLIALAQTSALYPIYNSIPGIGPITAALLIAELKDIRRFTNVKKLTASCGLDPTIVQSGKSINYHGPISKRGNRSARHILFYAVMSILMVTKRTAPQNSILLYYEKKRGEGKHHHACVVACCTKLIRILLAMSKQNTLYC